MFCNGTEEQTASMASIAVAVETSPPSNAAIVWWARIPWSTFGFVARIALSSES